MLAAFHVGLNVATEEKRDQRGIGGRLEVHRIQIGDVVVLASRQPYVYIDPFVAFLNVAGDKAVEPISQFVGHGTLVDANAAGDRLIDFRH